jgi:hypothetical protein
MEMSREGLMSQRKSNNIKLPALGSRSKSVSLASHSVVSYHQ